MYTFINISKQNNSGKKSFCFERKTLLCINGAKNYLSVNMNKQIFFSINVFKGKFLLF